MKTIPIFFTFDKYYVVAAEVAIYSMLKHASTQYEYRLYVLHTNIPVSAQKDLTALANRFKNASLEFIDTSSFDVEKSILQSKAHFSKEIYYKLIAAEIFPEYDRIICSDVDVVFLDDISESYFLYENEFFYFAGVGQILESNRMETYKNKFSDKECDILEKEIAAGYLLMNLKAIREKHMQQKLTEFYKANYHRLCLPEQDCICLCCWPYTKYLPMKYVVCNYYYKVTKNNISFFSGCEEFQGNKEQAVSRFMATLENPVQLHYVGHRKPWNSFFVPKQKIWLLHLFESGCVFKFIKAFPILYLRKFRRYNIKRFCHKIMRHIASN